MINLQEFADRISGQEYPFRDIYFTRTINLDIECAKANDLVIAFGASDDLLQFRGAIYDEVDAPCLVHIVHGKVISEATLNEDLAVLSRYGIVHSIPYTAIVKAVWSDHGYPSWSISVEGLESASFDIMEDGNVYCKGAVFQLPSIEVRS